MRSSKVRLLFSPFRLRLTSPFLLRSVVLIILAVLVGSLFVDWHRLFVKGLNSTFNDQVGYISVARNFAETGRLDSDLIYPSTLNQQFKRNSVYMPGHYWTMAEVFRVAGYSVGNSFVPSLCGYVLASLLIYFIGCSLCNPMVGYYSCALFAFFPLNLSYAFTALGEMDLMASVMIAFGLFLLLPARHRVWGGPLVLLLPLLFRETSIVLTVLMAAIIFFKAQQERKRILLFSLLSCLVLILVLLSAGSGRPSLWGPNILCNGRFEAVYADAYAIQRIHPVAKDWVVAVGRKFFSNSHELVFPKSASSPPSHLEYLSMICILSGIPLGFLLWWQERKAFMIGISAMVLLLLLLDLCFYSVWEIRGVKSLLICEPFVAVLWASLFEHLLARRSAGNWLSGLLVVGLFIIGTIGMRSVFRHESEINEQTARDTAFIESIVDDDQSLLVSPWRLSLDYVNKHHPVRWAFLPANCPTMQLLNSKEGIGTLITPEGAGIEVGASPCGTGLRFDGEKVWRGTRYLVFRRAKAEAGRAK
jgi:hypothetical protein